MPNNKQGRTSGRVLFTGNGRRVIDNLAEYMPPHFTVQKCAPEEMDFCSALEKFHPQVVVVCLMDETPGMLRMYQILEGNPDYANIPLVALGQAEDCELFKKRVFAANLEVFPRPLDQKRFLQAVEQYVQMAQENEPDGDGLDTAPAKENAIDRAIASARDAARELTQKADAPAPAAAPGRSASARLAGRKSILVVDDDVLMLNVIKSHLEDFYDITVVPSGKLAVKFLAKRSADLVLLDYLMPDMDGPAVLQVIREDSPNPDVPVIFLTGVNSKEMVMRGLDLRPNGYLLKPVSREALLERVTEVLLETGG